MIIKATFANRKYSPDDFELIDAWDEWSIDENPEGFKRSLDLALHSMGDDLLRYVTVEIDVPYEPIYRALKESTLRVEGDVRL